MVQKVTFRRKNTYSTRSNKIKKTRTPGNYLFLQLLFIKILDFLEYLLIIFKILQKIKNVENIKQNILNLNYLIIRIFFF